MANYKSKRHYRVAQKEVQHNLNGQFITNEDAHRQHIIVFAVIVLVFIKGVILGSLLSKK